MSPVIVRPELFANDLPNQDRSPEAGFQTVGHRPTVQDVAELLPLLGIELDRSARTLSLPQPFLAVVIPTLDPEGNAAAMHLEQPGDGWRRVAFEAEHDAMQSLSDAWDSILEGFAAQPEQSLHRPLVSFGKHRIHIAKTAYQRLSGCRSIYARLYSSLSDWRCCWLGGRVKA